MQKKFVVNFISRILFLVSLFLILPLLWSFTDPSFHLEIEAFSFTILLGLLSSSIFLSFFKVEKIRIVHASAKDALSVVGLSWIVLSLLGATPLFITGVVPSYTDAVFEIVSGFTTTGASIFNDVEILPRGILFWRSLTHWLGGLGVIALFIALFPSLGVTSMRLYNLEASGLDYNKPDPLIRRTAAMLWKIYVFLTVVSVLLLYACGMPLFDALCHAFGAIATGGFSTQNASIGAYGANIQWIIIVIMILGGINFSLYIGLFHGRIKRFFQDEEFRLYLFLLLAASGICLLLLSSNGDFLNNVRPAVFQVVSLMTATGFATADFNLWPYATHAVFLLLMFIGGCAGSTSGGFKVVRTLLSFKKMLKTIQQAIYPHSLTSVRLDGVPLQDNIVFSIMVYFILYFTTFVFGVFSILLFDSCDITTAVSASISALSSVGPGLGRVGPALNYAWMSIPSKWTLIFLMLAGRLELFAIFVLFIPATWRK
ncbi:MAG: TrkH family potassium uptake protein [Candidatus Aureabacteria bacterium]|nr:TrkH family potassium uptake protein [Candidatus Auribacterota bacterium]